MPFSFCTLLLVLVLGSLPATAQSPLRDSALQSYYRFIRENAAIFSGSAYLPRGTEITGHPFYREDSLQSGSLVCQGILYENIPLKYEIFDDALILKDYTQNYFIRLNSSKIAAFSLANAEFVRPSYDDPALEADHPGFYQRIYLGNSEVLVKHKKVLLYKTTVEKTLTWYEPYQFYYIRKGNEWFTIRSGNDMARAFSDKKTEIRRFLQNKDKFKKNPLELLKATAAYYDQLTRK